MKTDYKLLSFTQGSKREAVLLCLEKNASVFYTLNLINSDEKAKIIKQKY